MTSIPETKAAETLRCALEGAIFESSCSSCRRRQVQLLSLFGQVEHRVQAGASKLALFGLIDAASRQVQSSSFDEKYANILESATKCFDKGHKNAYLRMYGFLLLRVFIIMILSFVCGYPSLGRIYPTSRSQGLLAQRTEFQKLFADVESDLEIENPLAAAGRNKYFSKHKVALSEELKKYWGLLVQQQIINAETKIVEPMSTQSISTLLEILLKLDMALLESKNFSESEHSIGSWNIRIENLKEYARENVSSSNSRIIDWVEIQNARTLASLRPNGLLLTALNSYVDKEMSDGDLLLVPEVVIRQQLPGLVPISFGVLLGLSGIAGLAACFRALSRVMEPANDWGTVVTFAMTLSIQILIAAFACAIICTLVRATAFDQSQSILGSLAKTSFFYYIIALWCGWNTGSASSLLEAGPDTFGLKLTRK